MSTEKRLGPEEADDMTITALDRNHVEADQRIDPTLHALFARLVAHLLIVSEHRGATRAQDRVDVDVHVRGRHVTTVHITREGAATVYTGWDGVQIRRIVDEDAYTLGTANARDRVGQITAWWKAQNETVPADSALALDRMPSRDRAGLLAYAVRYHYDEIGTFEAIIGRPDAINEYRAGVSVAWTVMYQTGDLLHHGTYRDPVEAAHVALMLGDETAH